MASLAHSHHHAGRRHPGAARHGQRGRGGRAGHNPLAAPVLVFAAVCVTATLYVAYVLWPRWPDVPVALDAPSLPISIAGVAFNIEPAAIRIPLQRRAGSLTRVDLAYLWPSLTPPDPTVKIINGVAVDPNERLFAVIQVDDGVMPLAERVQSIYPRYLTPEPQPGPDGLTLRPFRNDTPYQGEELVFDQSAPEHFMARCSRKGVINSGTCLLERKIGDADITFRFPRSWLKDWKSVAAGIDKLMTRLHPN
ncbi:MAG: hypothetical protein GC182_20935 [Rhodopseudomonas sp.]|nr:hypothetical protein [Rhodopseudomonas sp.]